MAQSKSWTFTQLAGPQKTLVLDGWQAPYGRPRLGTLVNEGVEIRKQVTYYAGDAPPTVHSFGRIGKPFEIHGRWMDAAIGLAGGAKAYKRAWKDFVSDQQEVRAKWGDVFSYRIFIHDIDLQVESEAHVAWTMKAEVLVDEQAPVTLPDLPVTHPQNIASLMATELDTAIPYQKPQFGSILDLLPEISDAIDTIVSDINTPFAFVFDTATALSDFETAASADLQKMGSGLSEVRSGLLRLRDTSDSMMSQIASLNTPNDYTPNGLFAGSDVQSIAFAKARADAATANLMALIADMSNQIDKATRGTVQSAHLAQDSDSFESIGTRTLGGPSAGRDIRALNGVRSGTKPTPGRTYQIPTSK